MARQSVLLLFLATVSVNGFIPFEFQELEYSPVQFAFNEDVDEEPLTKCCTEFANFNFRAYGREFPLRMQRSCAAGNDEASEGVEFTDGGSTWQGHLEDEPNSTVDGDVVDGKFAGIILTGDGEKFMVERKDRPNGRSHSLIYKVTSRKRVMNTLFPELTVDEASGELGSGLEIVEM